MDNLIDESYFRKGLKIDSLFKNSGVSGRLVNEAGYNASTELYEYIRDVQDEYLKAMFGDDISSDMPPELIEYIRDEEKKLSPLANYVYYFYKTDNETITSASGEIKPIIANTMIISAKQKMINAWNEMVRKNRQIHDALYELGDITVFKGTDKETTLSYSDDIGANVDFYHDIFDYINKWE